MDDVHFPVVFQRFNRSLRGVCIDGQPWLVARDLGVLIRERVEHYVIHRLDDDLRRQAVLVSRSGEECVWLVNDFGLFHLLARYRHPEHRNLRQWLTGEVLPTLRDQAESRAEQPRRMHLQGPTAPLTVLLWQGELWMRFGDMPRLLAEQTRNRRWSHWLPGRRDS
ncbi:Bro-N domain-containing protein [Pseudomonas sp. QL9]|uniref:BRO-N domain-containing protein n=1 Tax=Pseudomonas sp. QL9 TaxID=3242725 RepID=UPI00352A149C